MSAIMKLIPFLLVVVAAASVAQAYDDQQKTDILTGLRLSFELGQAYQEARQGINITQFNALVDQFNGWIQQNIGTDPSLMMSKMEETQQPATGSPSTESPAMQGDLGSFGGVPNSRIVQVSDADLANMQALRADQMIQDFLR